MSTSPLVSVVIPVRDGAPFIAEAIDSVLAQSYRNLECIVVDDGSTDGTAEIVEAYGDRVRNLTTGRGGVSAARNLGIERASGELIAFLDADDVWLPLKLEKQVAMMERHPDAALCYTGLKLIDVHGNVLGTRPPPPAKRAFRNTLLIEGPPISVAQTGLVPRRIAKEVGGFDERMSTSADADFACRIARDRPVVPVNEPLVLYRKHPGQMHLDPDLTEHDQRLLFEKFFSDGSLPPDIQRRQRLAYANLYLSIANRYRRLGRSASMLRYVRKGVTLHPAVLLTALKKI